MGSHAAQAKPVGHFRGIAIAPIPIGKPDSPM
jgi:hypothetical protein